MVLRYGSSVKWGWHQGGATPLEDARNKLMDALLAGGKGPYLPPLGRASVGVLPVDAGRYATFPVSATGATLAVELGPRHRRHLGTGRDLPGSQRRQRPWPPSLLTSGRRSPGRPVRAGAAAPRAVRWLFVRGWAAAAHRAAADAERTASPEGPLLVDAAVLDGVAEADHGIRRRSRAGNRRRNSILIVDQDRQVGWSLVRLFSLAQGA
jgi:hypothetical protein